MEMPWEAQRRADSVEKTVEEFERLKSEGLSEEQAFSVASARQAGRILSRDALGLGKGFLRLLVLFAIPVVPIVGIFLIVVNWYCGDGC